MSSGTLIFTHTPWLLAISITFVIFVVLLAFMAWRQSGWRASIGWLETLRVLVATGIALTLNQPEWRETFLTMTFSG
ncbi:MAG: hypothetical protein ACI8T1_004179 [Verrucomicrobiales bacterium]|jgi:hypothetical protein